MTLEWFSLKGRIALVTGGSRGLGLMMAEGLLRCGAKVYVASRSAKACAEATQYLAQFGEVDHIVSDLSTERECEALITQLRLKETKLHVLVSNAGASWGAAFDEHPDHAWDKLLAINLKAPAHLAKFALPLLRAAATPESPARVINIGSVDGIRVPQFDNFAYAASKAGVHQLTRHMASVLAPQITVNAIAPGIFPSKMTRGMLEQHGEELVEATLLKRVGRPADVMGLIAFLASDAASYITGSILPVDGGMLARS
jgi:NAD(P)-dependent dehydrogenase (short-subunit alcohol dehydrogenase family)